MKDLKKVLRWAAGACLLLSMLLGGMEPAAGASGADQDAGDDELQESGAGLLTEADLPGFREASEEELTGDLALARRLTAGLFDAHIPLGQVSLLALLDAFREEAVITFLAYPLPEGEVERFDALAGQPGAVLAALGEVAAASGASETAGTIPGLDGIGDVSMGFSLVLGGGDARRGIEVLWARRGNILQSTWIIHPAGESPAISLQELGRLVDERIQERFPGTVFRPAGQYVPELTTTIPTPLDLSARPGVIGTNLLLAAVMMLPFAAAAEVFTRLVDEREKALAAGGRLAGPLRRWTEWMRGGGRPGGRKRAAAGGVLRLLLVVLFYGVTFSLLDRTWKPFTPTGLVLFLDMVLAYGIVGIADDILQWRALRKWGMPAQLALRPTNLLLSVLSTLASRLIPLVPGLMFGTPEALVVDETRLSAARRNRLLGISAATFLVTGFGLWVATTGTTLLQRGGLSGTAGSIIGGVEAFLLVIFAVALENTFVQMLGFPGSFGEALRKRSRWLWMAGLTGVAFIFYHTLINPRGDLARAVRETNILILLGAAGAFVVLTFAWWLINRARRGKPAGERKPAPRRNKAQKKVPAWAWLAVNVVGLMAIGTLLLMRQEAGGGEAAATPIPSPATLPTAAPSLEDEGAEQAEGDYSPRALAGSVCFVPSLEPELAGYDEALWNSVRLAAAQYGASASMASPETLDDGFYPEAVEKFTQAGCDLIVGTWQQEEAFREAAEAHPDQHFWIWSGTIDLPNTWRVDPLFGQGTYLAGYLAAGLSQAGTVGTLGVDLPGLFPLMDCTVRGVNAHNLAHGTDVTVLGWDMTQQAGLLLPGFDRPEEGELSAGQLFDQGADVILPVVYVGPGTTGAGVLEAADERGGVGVIGIDFDWGRAFPEYQEVIVTSVLNHFELEIALALEALVRGEFSGGAHTATVLSGAIGLAPLGAMADRVSPELRAELAQLAQRSDLPSCQPEAVISGFLNLDAVAGSGWSPGGAVEIRVFASPGGEVLFTGEATPDSLGDFYQDVSMDLVPGMFIEVTAGMDIESVTLVPLTIEAIDPEEDHILGRAPEGAGVDLFLGETGKSAFFTTEADATGTWQVDTSRDYDLTTRTGVQAQVPDARGNATVVKINLAMLTTPLPTLTPSLTLTPRPTSTPDKGVYNPANGHWYRPFGVALGYAAAQRFCEKMGAHLVTIADDSENLFVYSMAPNLNLGASDSAEEGRWEWVTGEPWSYTNWDPGEPNDMYGEDFLQFYLEADVPGTWNDVPDFSGPLMCEWDQ